jgi:hypothetical protein
MSFGRLSGCGYFASISSYLGKREEAAKDTRKEKVPKGQDLDAGETAMKVKGNHRAREKREVEDEEAN